MKAANKYYRSKFSVMQQRGWVVVPYPQEGVSAELSWCRTHGAGSFYYVSEANKYNWSFVFSDPVDAAAFVAHFITAGTPEYSGVQRRTK